MSESLSSVGAAELSARLAAGTTTAVAIARDCLARVRALDARIGAFLHIDEADILSQAEASDRRRAEGLCLGPLDGIPVGIKDNISVLDQPLTCASRILEHYVSPYDATVVARLRDAGAVLFGRLNMDEFAMGSTTETSHFRKCRNPWDEGRVPGGSSGGSAAALAARFVPLALGSDTGGSIRQPASHCGVTGLKPTYGLVSRYGLAAFASSLDQIGPMARSVEDAAVLLQAIAGRDPRDSTSFAPAQLPDYLAESRTKGPWTVGVPREYLSEALDPEVKALVVAAIDFYKSIGCTIREVSLPHTDYAIPTYYILATAEASSNLARYDGVRYTRRSGRTGKDTEYSAQVDLYFKSRGEGFGEEVKRRIILGTYVLSSGYYDAYYVRAQKVRSAIRRDFMQALEGCDFLLAPVSPTPAPRFGEEENDPVKRYLGDIYSISANLAGLPALALPAGFTAAGLPVGIQLTGVPFSEGRLLAAGRAFEAATGHGRCAPAL